MPVRFLIAQAYSVKLGEIYGGPEWVNTDGYDILAKAEVQAGVSYDLNASLQSLLETRFALRTHRETRELPVYELTVSKGGPKLEPSNCVPFDPNAAPQAGQTRVPFCGTSPLQKTDTGWRFVAGGITMGDLIGQLSFGDIRWIDRTGYTGAFNATIEWTPDSLTPEAPNAGQQASPQGQSIFTALQEQLGLKLVSTKAPIEVLVIDQAQRPTAN